MLKAFQQQQSIERFKLVSIGQSYLMAVTMANLNNKKLN